MTTSKKIDRKKFLASTVAAFSTVTLGSCAGESDGGDTGATGGTNTGGTNTGGTATGGTATGGTATGGAGGLATGGSVTGGAGGLATGGSATGGAGGAMGGAPPGGSSGSGGSGGMSGGGSGGDGGGGGVTYVCTFETNNGDHSHPLTIPSSHIERGYGEENVPYVLEAGGTGHTHTLVLGPYQYVYLQGGTEVEEPSSETNGHTHNCVINCVR